MAVLREVIGDAQLFRGDARDVLPTLDPVDLLASDPPYRLKAGGNTTGAMGGKFKRGVYDNSGAIIPVDIEFAEFFPLLADVLPRGHAYVMVNNANVHEALNQAKAAGFRLHNLLVWDKGTATPNRWYMKNCEFTLFLFRGKAISINDCGSRQLVKIPNIINGEHETEKPVELMAHYVANSSKPGQTVLDPFMGSGSTGVAALKHGRKFIGIEKDPDYFELACRRIERVQHQGDLFLEGVAA